MRTVNIMGLGFHSDITIILNFYCNLINSQSDFYMYIEMLLLNKQQVYLLLSKCEVCESIDFNQIVRNK